MMKLLVIFIGITIRISASTGNTIQYTCKTENVLSVSKQTENEIGMQQIQPPICGEVKTCMAYSKGSACLSKGQYVAGVVENNDVVTVGCCQYEPVKDHSGDDCQEIFIETSGTSPNVGPIPPSRTKGSPPKGAGSNKEIVEMIYKDEPAPNPLQLVKAITKIKHGNAQGYSVTVCTPQCGRTTTKRPTTPTSPHDKQEPQKQPEGGHPKKSLLGGHHCFSGDMTVTTRYGTKRMDEVRAGDEVLVMTSDSQSIFEPIEWLYHRDHNEVAEFVTVITRSNRLLRLSPNHLIPIVPCSENEFKKSELDQLADSNSFFARRLRVGHCIAAKTNSTGFIADEITSISRERLPGIYSPITNYGTIIVNDLYVSCFSSVENHLSQRTVHSSLIKIRRVVAGIWNSVFGIKLDREDTNVPLPLQILLKMATFVVPANVYSG